MSRANPRFHRNNALLPLLVTPAYRVQPFYLVDNQICLWTIDYIMTTSAQGPTSESNIANSWQSTVSSSLRACLSSDCFWYGVHVFCLTAPARMPYTYVVAGGSQTGTVTGTHIPSEMAAILSKVTSTKGQHGRGRAYLPGIPSTFLTPATDANRLNALGSSSLAALATGLQLNTIVDSGNVAVAGVTQSVRGGLPTTRGQVLAGMTVRTLLGTVRRRRISRGK